MAAPPEVENVRRRAELVCSAAEVDAAIERMAREAAALVADRDPVVLPVMLGGAYTAVGLCRHFDFAYELDSLQVGRYGDSLEGGTLEWSLYPRLELRGRTVLLVDDVLDRGVTLRAVADLLRRMGVAALRIAVLVSKRVAPEPAAGRPQVDVVGIECPDRYLFGCGMDYKGYWRGLPALYAVRAT